MFGLTALATVGMIFNTIANIGYVIAGGIFVKTGIQYFSDYKDSVQREKDGWE